MVCENISTRSKGAVEMPSQKQEPRFQILSEDCILVIFGDSIDESNHRRVLALHLRLASSPFPGFVESVPAFASIAVFFRNPNLSERFCGFPEIIEELRSRIVSNPTESLGQPRVIVVPTRFGGKHGFDLAQVASRKGMSETEFIEAFATPVYRVFMLGFRPGFPYMGTLPSELGTERLSTPRGRVPAGSVGIAGQQTGIYPIDSPGGWNIIGKTDLKLVDLEDEETPTIFRAGDLVKFEPI